MFPGFRYDVPRGRAHARFELFGNVFRRPIEVRVVLYLFEIADRDSTGVREDVGNDRYALLKEDRVGLGRRGSVGEFENESGLQLVRVLCGDAVFERRGNEYVDFEFQKFVSGNSDRSGVFRYRFPFFFQTGDYRRIHSRVEPRSALRVGRRYDLRAGGMEDFDHREPGVARPFDGDGFAFEVLSRDSQILGEDEEPALRRRAIAPLRSSGRERLSGKCSGRPFSGQAGVFVHHPGHDFRIGVHVRSRNVGAGSEVFVKAADVRARQAFEFVFRKFRRVHDDSALAASERQV